MNNKCSATWLQFIFAALVITLIGCGAYSFMKNSERIETDILALLPQHQDNDYLRLADEKVAHHFERKVILLIAHPHSAQSAAGGALKILGNPALDDIFLNYNAAFEEKKFLEFVEFYKNHSATLLTDQQKQWLLDDNLAAIRRHILAKTYGFGIDPLAQDIQKDPFYFFSDALSELNTQGIENISFVQGVPVIAQDGQYYAVVQAELAGSPFAIQFQEKTLSALDEIQSLIIEEDPELNLVRSGFIFHAANGTKTAQGEISMMSSLSMAGVFILLLFVFRSLRPFIVSSITIVFGALVALCTCILLFGKIHILTLVFGTSLIGISTDYILHFLAERFKADNWDAQSAIKSIFSGITLGMLTSVIGFLGLCLTPIASLQQMAVFSITGLVFVYGCVVLYYPAIFKNFRRSPAPSVLNISAAFLNLYKRNIVLLRARIFVLSMFLIFTLACVFLPGKDDIRTMQTLSPALLKNDMHIAKILGAPISSQMFVVTAPNLTAMLDEMDKLTARLNQLKSEGSIGDYTALNLYIDSPARQEENLALLQSFTQEHENELIKIFAEVGLSEEDFIRYQTYLQEQKSNFYTPEKFLNQVPVPELNMLYEDNLKASAAGFVLLKNNADSAVLQELAQDNSNIIFLDKVSALSKLLGDYRQNAVLFATLAYLVIFALLVKRYGAAQGSLILLPCAAAAVLTLCLVAGLNGGVSLFHILALFIIMGTGVDYAIFLIESAKDNDQNHVPRAMSAIFLSAITTLLSFGLLSASATTALYDFGLTTIFGIIITLLLTPLVIKQTTIFGEKQ